MPRPRNAVPTYTLHKQSGRARLLWTDHLGVRQQRLLPGPFGSPESLAAKASLELELATAPARAPAGTRLSVAEVLAAFLAFAVRHYCDQQGNPTDEVRHLKAAIRPVRELYGTVPATSFGPLALKAVRRSARSRTGSGPLWVMAAASRSLRWHETRVEPTAGGAAVLPFAPVIRSRSPVVFDGSNKQSRP